MTKSIVMTGEVLPGFSLSQVQHALAGCLEMTVSDVACLFGTSQDIVLIYHLPDEDALVMVALLASMGLVAKAVPEGTVKPHAGEVCCPQCGYKQSARIMCKKCGYDIQGHIQRCLMGRLERMRQSAEADSAKFTKQDCRDPYPEKRLFRQPMPPGIYHFSVKGRLGAMAYLETLLWLTGAFILEMLVLILVLGLIGGLLSVAFESTMVLLLLPVMFYSWGLLRANVLRGHDAGWAAYWIIPLWCILFAGTALFFYSLMFPLDLVKHKALISFFPVFSLFAAYSFFKAPQESKSNQYGVPNSADNELVFVPRIYNHFGYDHVVVYTCNNHPGCTHLRAQLKLEGIPFIEYNIDKDRTKAKLLWLKLYRDMCSRSVADEPKLPVVEVNGVMLWQEPTIQDIERYLKREYIPC